MNENLFRNEESAIKDHHKAEDTPPSDRKSRTLLFVLFLIFLAFGWVAIGPIQWGNIPLPDVAKLIYKIIVPLAFLLVTILLYKTERLHEYWQVFFAFFVGSFAFFIAWAFSFLLMFQTTTVEGFALTKLVESIFLVIPIIVLVKISRNNLGSVYLKKGNLKLGLIIGFTSFFVFMIISFAIAELLFFGINLTVEKVISWIPWILIFIFANAAMEELLYRGLFLGKYELHLEFKWTNLLQATIFALMHFGVTYTSDQFIFLAIDFILGLVWGYMVHKTKSIIGSTLFHAGANFILIIGIFSTF
jgi:membrane protease YdiL (CAAX protease family)